MRRLALLLPLLALGCDDGESAPGPTTRLEETDLGEFRAGPFTDPAEVDVPGDALSLTVVAQSESSGVISLEIEAPDGTLLVDALAPLDSPNPVFAWTRVTVAQIPIRPEVSLQAGRYQIRALYGGVEATLSMRAFVKRPVDAEVDVDADGQVLALTVFQATSLVAPGDVDLDRAIDDAIKIWAQADVSIERAGEHDLGDVGPVTETGPELDRLLERSAGLAAGAVPVFVVEDLLSVPTESLAGLTATVPLPPIDGTPRSGILLSAPSLHEFPDLAGQIVAHEIGHALGLVHVTERTGLEYDPLADTAECSLEHDTDGDGAVSIGECRAHGALNLMFWACCASRNPEISADQRFVALRSALAR